MNRKNKIFLELCYQHRKHKADPLLVRNQYFTQKCCCSSAGRKQKQTSSFKAVSTISRTRREISHIKGRENIIENRLRATGERGEKHESEAIFHLPVRLHVKG